MTGWLSGQYHEIKDILDALESCNFGIIGEGEITVVELCHAINEGENFEEINGIIFKKGNKYIKTKRRVEISDLDSILFPDYKGLNEKMVKLLKESNCIAISFGLEIADNKILTSMKKFTTIEQIEKALKIVNDCKIRIVGNFIFGDIEETIKTAKNTHN